MTRSERKAARKMKVLLLIDGYLGNFSNYLETHTTDDSKENVEMIKRSFVYMIDKINLDIKSHINEAEMYREVGYLFVDKALTIINQSLPGFFIDADSLKLKLNQYIT